MIVREGYKRFHNGRHIRLWKHLNAKDPAKGYGAIAVGNRWCWLGVLGRTGARRVFKEIQRNMKTQRSVRG